MTHILRCPPHIFREIHDGVRTVDIRKRTRHLRGCRVGFRVGDAIEYLEWVPDGDAGTPGRYTGNAVRVAIVGLLDSPAEREELAVQADDVALSIVVRVTWDSEFGD